MITIEIVSDIVCPWCFIGLRRLDEAIADVRQTVPDLVCHKHWHPFFLNPDTPPEGEPYLPFLERKFDGRAKVEAIFEHVRSAGRSHGVEFAFEKIQVRANTLNAHRLIHWAQQQGNADALVERLFAAQFQQGENVADLAVLASIADECGYNRKDTEDYLASAADTEISRQLEKGFRDMGVSAVPTFIIGHQRVIVGAQAPSVIAEGLRQVLQRGSHDQEAAC